MHRVLRFLPYLFGLILGYFTWPVIELVFDSAESPDVRLLSAAISAGAVLTATLISQTIAHRRDVITQQSIRVREIEDSLRDRKVEAYSELLGLFSAYIQGTNASNRKKSPSLQQTLNRIEKFQNAIMLWGSPHVVKAWLEYRKNSESDSADIFEHVNLLYLAIRDDIGLSNEGLESYELMQVYLKNPDEIHQVLKRDE